MNRVWTQSTGTPNRIGMLIGIGVLIKKQNKNQIRMLNPIISVVIMLTQMWVVISTLPEIHVQSLKLISQE